MKKILLWCLLLLGLDIVSKIWALAYIPSYANSQYPFGGIPVFSFFEISGSLNLVTNKGAAMGLFDGYSTLLFGARIIIILALLVYLFFSKAKKHPFPLWLVTAGAIGNAIDTVAYGHVIDFLHFCFWGHSFPIFNLADCYITCGVVLLFLFSKKEKTPHLSVV